MGELQQRTVDVDVREIKTEGNTLRGHAAVFGVLSEDLGGFRERIAPGAFAGVIDDADVRLLVDHNPPPLARTKAGTLRLHEDERGLAFEADLPDTSYAKDLRESVRRGDLDGMSFRFKVGEEDWDGEVRTVKTVASLSDICLATYPAYPEASVELRTRPPEASEDEEKEMENREGGGLKVEDRTASHEPEHRDDAGTLADEFRTAGFDEKNTGTIPFRVFERRAVALASGTTTDKLAPTRVAAVALGFDTRYAWPVFPSSAVDDGTTSVDVLRQKSRTLPAASSVVRNLDATTAKPEVGSEIELVSKPLKQVAAKESGIPNIHLSQPAIAPIVNLDLRLAVNEGLDKLVLDEVATAGFQAPGTDSLLVSIRKAITTIEATGYSPDTLILRPSDAEALDTLRVTPGATPTEEEYVFGPGQFAPRVWNLNRRISKSAASPVVVDSQAFGRLHASPVSLKTFEENDGSTNTSLVRLELHALFAVQRLNAAVRIAAS